MEFIKIMDGKAEVATYFRLKAWYDTAYFALKETGFHRVDAARPKCYITHSMHNIIERQRGSVKSA